MSGLVGLFTLPDLNTILLLVGLGGCLLVILAAAGGAWLWLRRSSSTKGTSFQPEGPNLSPAAAALESTAMIQPGTAHLLVAVRSGNRPLVEIPPEGLSIGRDAKNGLCLDDVQVSRSHARIEFLKNHWQIEDLESANGVFVNHVRVRSQELHHEDVISLGQTELIFLK